MDKDKESIAGNSNSEDNSNDAARETENDTWNDKNSEGGRQEDEKLAELEKKDNEKKEESASCQEEDNEKEAENDGKKAEVPGGDNKELNQEGYSAVFEAPFYAPIINNGENVQKKKRRADKRTKALLITAISLGIVIALLIGATAGLGAALLIIENSEETPGSQSAQGFDSTQSSDTSGEGETVTIVRTEQDPSRVEEIINTPEGEPMSVAGVVNKVASSVVEVTTLKSSYYGQYVSSGAGSGVIIGKSESFSYIVTNYHVVGESDGITVRLNDRREYEAIYIDGDEDMDIAVIKIAETDGIVQAKIGSSGSLIVGESVVAIGNPLGELGGTVTDGIISALDREINVDGVPMTLLQTNAAINPGNSGGGLFNMYGELIGIVNAKQSASGIEGLGFAIPIDHVYDEIVDVLEDGYIHGRLTFGFEVAYLDAYNAYRYFKTAEAGIYVITSTEPSIITGDKITAVNSAAVSTAEELMSELEKVKIGDTVIFGVKRSKNEIAVPIIAREYVPTASVN